MWLKGNCISSTLLCVQPYDVPHPEIPHDAIVMSPLTHLFRPFWPCPADALLHMTTSYPFCLLCVCQQLYYPCVVLVNHISPPPPPTALFTTPEHILTAHLPLHSCPRATYTPHASEARFTLVRLVTLGGLIYLKANPLCTWKCSRCGSEGDM